MINIPNYNFMRWLIDGDQFARNPDSYTLTPVTPNVQYSIEASGRQVRTQARRLLSAYQMEINWHNADEILRRAISIHTMKNSISKIVFVGSKPTRSLWAYFDVPTLTSSQDVVDKRPGMGGHRTDIKITGNTDGPYTHSYYNVPSAAVVDPNFVANSFLGITGKSSYDFLPNWNGFGWNRQPVLNQPIRISNMGTAEWEPYIRINGPFSALAINAAYEDVDGTGYGVDFTWIGNAVADGDYLLFDTASARVFQSISGSINEVYTFAITEHASGNPFPYFPPAPMGEFVITPIVLSGTNADTSIDYSNNGTETFRYR